ncbi:hypothetical protein GCM10009799_36270 [Nocardiopsis rhodophaea]|uniref:HTH gntR-type domain-containing protein n=1 Tax=Nocardiopsis rhodophaea TaxID=280238 RepID=A0ABP5ET29_9ACTN
MDFGPDDEIEHDDPIPPYRQLAAILRAQIQRGDYKPRRPIPSEERLVQDFGLSRPTVRKAIRVLVDEGILFVVPQRGTYVAEKPAGSADAAD